MKLGELFMGLVNIQGDSASSPVVAIMPDGLPLTIKSIEVETHETGPATVWLHVEEI